MSVPNSYRWTMLGVVAFCMLAKAIIFQSIPPILGIIKSKIIKFGEVLLAFSKPSSPSLATSTSKFSLSNRVEYILTIGKSSSIKRTFPADFGADPAGSAAPG